MTKGLTNSLVKMAEIWQSKDSRIVGLVEEGEMGVRGQVAGQIEQNKCISQARIIYAE